MSNKQCERCAKRAECGVAFEPRIDIGECGHDDGCADFAARKETVREVCDEIKVQTYQTTFVASEVIGWRDRLLDAYERKIAEKDAEIARLKAALKPVIECATKSAEGSMPNYMGCWDAVREAHRIAKEGELAAHNRVAKAVKEGESASDAKGDK